MKTLASVVLIAAALTGSTPSNINWMDYKPEVKEVAVVEEEEATEVIELEVIPWKGDDFSENEEVTLDFLQEQGITDKMALAVILGNIKQESKFHPNICEGGARVKYHQCHRGGYGLVQWTTSFRYWGLGNHAKKISGDPSELKTQLSYMVTEVEWIKAKKMFVNPDQTLEYYMRGADIWLGWGIYGNRGYYSKDYYNRLSQS